MKHRLNIADAITASRIVFAVLILFCAAFSMQFYAFYLLGGFTDMIDGHAARKLNQKSSFGAKLDTIADLVFVTAVLIKVLPALHMPAWMWIWIVIIAIIKLTNLVTGLVLLHGIVGIGMGASRQVTEIAVIAACSAATLAAVQEGHFIRMGKEIE